MAGSFIGGGIGRAPTPAGAPGIPGIGAALGMLLGAPGCGPIPGGRFGIGGKVGAVRDAVGGGDGWFVCASASIANAAMQKIATRNFRFATSLMSDQNCGA
ncbi:MAG: hypothetical protein QOG48_1994 [Verrucomicrobiota bacterium]|jgi:hypothetical protein